MVVGALVALAQVAGQTVVAAATTDAWEKAKRGFARLLGRGDAGKTEAAADRLESTRVRLDEVTGADLERVRGELAAAWQVRLADLLEDDPGLAGELQELVDQVRAELPVGQVTAAGHGVAAGRDVTVTASSGGVAAGTIHGNVSPNPTQPGPAN